MAAFNPGDDEARIHDVLKKLQSEKPTRLTDVESKMPSTATEFIGSNVRVALCANSVTNIFYL